MSAIAAAVRRHLPTQRAAAADRSMPLPPPLDLSDVWAAVVADLGDPFATGAAETGPALAEDPR